MRKIERLLSFGVLIGLVAAGYWSYRNRVIDRLYGEAAGIPPFFQSSAASSAALAKLATYHGRRSTEFLLKIATRENPIGLETQAEAIKMLSAHREPEVGTKLSLLLQPQVSLDTRMAVAITLQGLPCKDECIASVLHYLERLWGGELNHEDRWVNSNGNVKGDGLASKKDALFAALYTVFRQNKSETFRQLAVVYGLGSTDPSLFALDLASRLGLQEACPYVLRSLEELNGLSPDYYRAPWEELRKTVASLKCQ